MNDLSRRDLLRVSATAAVVAVPMAALAGSPANAAVRDADLDSGESLGTAPVMFRISNAATGEVSILHGESEVTVTDRRLVSQIMKAARARQSK